MENQSRESASLEEAGKHPLDRDIRSPGTWTYFACYLLIGSASVIILVEVIESGLWVKLGLPCLMIWFGMMGLIAARRNERIHLGKHSQ